MNQGTTSMVDSSLTSDCSSHVVTHDRICSACFSDIRRVESLKNLSSISLSDMGFWIVPLAQPLCFSNLLPSVVATVTMDSYWSGYVRSRISSGISVELSNNRLISGWSRRSVRISSNSTWPVTAATANTYWAQWDRSSLAYCTILPSFPSTILFSSSASRI